jgi:transcriptional regulator with GAF, ATPase, and Fis domain
MVKGNPEGVLTVDRLFADDVSFEEDIRFLTVLATLIAQFVTLHREIEKKEAKLIEENASLKAKLHYVHKGHFIIGHSKPMQEVFSVIDKISSSKVTALLLGESGTGKELVAKAIHEGGRRKDNPFIKVNCAALPETLLESELFSHFLSQSNERNGRTIKITAELLDFLISYSWPGNVREMQNLVERMVILAEGDRLGLADLPSSLFSMERLKQEKSREVGDKAEVRKPTFTRKSLQDIERPEIEAALRRNGWVQVRAANELGLTERQIGYRIKKYGLNRYESFR